MVPATTDKFQTWADIPCLSVTSIKQIIGSETMQPDSFIPFYMFVSYTFFFFFFFFTFSIYTVLFGSGAHPAFYSSGTVGFSPGLKSLIPSFLFLHAFLSFSFILLLSTYHPLLQCFPTFVRPWPSKFFFHKTRARSQQIYSSVPFHFFLNSYIKLT